MFNPYYGLFMYAAIDNYTLMINPARYDPLPVCGVCVWEGECDTESNGE